ncbi:MAG: polysaccharide deacetylase family protein, partial [Vicinamibacteria bacterium]
RLEILIASSHQTELTLRVGEEERTFDLRGSLPPVLQAVGAWLRELPEPERRAVLAQIETHCGPVKDFRVQRNFGFLSWGDVREMDRQDLVRFGAHSTSHTLVTRLEEAAFQKDSSEAKSAIEKRLKRPVIHYGYPFGIFGSGSPTILKRCGYASAVTTRHGLVDPDSDAFHLRRVGISDGMGYFLFCCSVSGLLEAVLRVKERWSRSANPDSRE